MNNWPTSDTVYIEFVRTEMERKIMLIKLTRKLFGWGLKEAKGWTEGHMQAKISSHNLDMLEVALSSFGYLKVVTPPKTLDTGW